MKDATFTTELQKELKEMKKVAENKDKQIKLYHDINHLLDRGYQKMKKSIGLKD